MSSRALRHLPLLLGLAALCGVTLDACGASPERPAAAATPTGPSALEEALANPSWESLGELGLEEYTRRQIWLRMGLAQPGLDRGRIERYLEGGQAPGPLTDRASEQLVNLAILEASVGRHREARALIALVRAQARNRNLAFAGSTVETELARREVGAGASPDTQQAAVQAALGALPRSRFGSSTVVYQLIQTEAQIAARIERIRQATLSLDGAMGYFYYQHILREVVRHRDVYLAAVEAVRQAHAAEPEPEPYAFSTVDLADRRYASARPVVIGVWDTGTDTEVYRRQLFATAERSHGVISDPDPAQTGYLYDPGQERIAEFAPFLRGIMDLRAGLSSSEAAQRVIQLMGGVRDAEGLETLSTNLDAIGEWAHGSHVAGIMLAGLPQGRLAIFRSAWAGEARVYHHRGPTDEELAAERANMEAIAAFLRESQVRVVNASLGFSRDYVEAELGHEREAYPNEAAIRARAEVIHRHRRDNWAWIFEQCPDTLFVVAAGNSNRDVVEYEDVPAALSAPNLLVVGAVDRYGSWATFTNSNTERVRVFDFGVEVPSRIPGGEEVPLSGTSMASPNVANLAAKLLSLDPSLTPPQVITIIEETASPIAEPFNGRIAHEQNAVDRVLAERAARPQGSERPAR